MKRVFSIAGGLLLLAGSWASAGTLNVGPGAPYRTIQAAIDAAQSGDVILVAAGVYRESLVITTGNLEIVGAGTAASVVESDEIPVRFVRAPGGRLEGFSLRYTGALENPVVLIEAASPLLVDNDISGGTLAGVESRNGAAPTLFGNHIHDNLGTGVLVHSAADATLTDNLIERNGLGEVHHPGIEVRDNGRAVVQFNRLLVNGGSGAFVHQGASVELMGNTIVGNGLHGVAIEDRAQAQVLSNSLWWNAEVGVLLRENGSATVAGNVVARNLMGIVLVKDAQSRATEPTQRDNLLLGNTRDTLGLGLSASDVALATAAVGHPQFQDLLQTVNLVGELLVQLRDAPLPEVGQRFIELAQAGELIVADLYKQAGLRSEAQTRYNIVIRLDLNSQAADRARAELAALGV